MQGLKAPVRTCLLGSFHFVPFHFVLSDFFYLLQDVAQRNAFQVLIITQGGVLPKIISVFSFRFTWIDRMHQSQIIY